MSLSDYTAITRNDPYSSFTEIADLWRPQCFIMLIQPLQKARKNLKFKCKFPRYLKIASANFYLFLKTWLYKLTSAPLAIPFINARISGE